MQETATQAYNKYRDYVLEIFSEQGILDSTIADYRKQIQKTREENNLTKEQLPDLTDEEIMDEIVADYTLQFLEDTQMFKDFISKSKEHKKLGQRMIDALKALIAKIKKNLSHSGIRDDYISKVEKALQLWEQAYQSGRDVVEISPAQKSTGDGKARRSISETERYLYDLSDFASQIDNISKIPSGEALVVCGTPEVFINIGLNRLPMTLNLEHVKDAITLNPNHKDRYIGKTALKDLPRALQEPVAIIASSSQNSTSLVAIVDLKGQNGKSVIAPVYLNGLSRTNGIMMDVNAISSAHERRNAVNGLLMDAINAEENGNVGVFYLDNKKATQLVRGEGLQLPDIFTSMNGLIHSIFDDGSPVKAHFKKIAQTETKQFKKWFGKSKVVDESGKPMVMYHGTTADFNIFSKEKAKRPGFFFVPEARRKKVAGYYSQGNPNGIKAVYLKIENPLISTTAEKIDPLLKNHGDHDGIIRIADSDMPEMTYYDYDSDTVKTEQLKKGDIVEVVVFESEQIKSATDNIGTFDRSNPDINYSIEGTENVVSENLEKARKQYGEIPKGENPVRNVRVPRKSSEGQNVSYTIRTALEAGVTPDVLVPKIEEKVIQGDFSEETHANKKTLAKAKKWLESFESTEKTQQAWSRAVKDGSYLNEETTVRGFIEQYVSMYRFWKGGTGRLNANKTIILLPALGFQ